MIYWDLILKTDDIKGHLARMYESMTLGQLAEHLGVSPSALRSKMESLGVERRPRGGSHKRLAYADLPNGIEDMTPEEIVSATGYSLSYARKLRRAHAPEQSSKD